MLYANCVLLPKGTPVTMEFVPASKDMICRHLKIVKKYPLTSLQGKESQLRKAQYCHYSTTPREMLLQNHLPLIRRMSSDKMSRLVTGLSTSLKSRDRQQTAVLIIIENYQIFFTSSRRVCQRYHTIFNAAAEQRNCPCGFESLVSSNQNNQEMHLRKLFLLPCKNMYPYMTFLQQMKFSWLLSAVHRFHFRD